MVLRISHLQDDSVRTRSLAWRTPGDSTTLLEGDAGDGVVCSRERSAWGAAHGEEEREEDRVVRALCLDGKFLRTRWGESEMTYALWDASH